MTLPNKFMKAANEFSNYGTYNNLTQSKIFALLDVPTEQREDFIQENKVEEMTTRQLQQAIKEKKDAENKRNSNDIWNIIDEVYDDNIYDIPIDKLKPFPNHKDYFWDMKGKNYLNFLTSIEENGVINPIIITRDNMIISGHQRVRACKDLGIDIIPARYLYTENKQNRKLDDLLLSAFFSCNMHTRSCVFYLALAWQDLYFGSKDKADYYIQKFIDEDDSESDEYIEELKERIKRIKK